MSVDFVRLRRTKSTLGARGCAGLTNGTNFVLDAVDKAVTNDAQWRARFPKGTPGDVGVNEVDWDQSGAAQNREAAADGLSLNRIEDGDFDPENPDDYYFVTTGRRQAGRPDRSAQQLA